MNYKIKSSLVFEYANENEAALTKKVLEPEIKEDINARSILQLLHEQNTLIIRINAKDLTVLRSIINTYIRWVNVVERIKNLKEAK
ncbi:MAG: KEOPS complex subunit Pcc1 [Candidatus Odinarchaeia archaeon]